MTRLARLLLVALAAAPALAAQPGSAPPTLQPGDPNDPVEKLGRFLRILSTEPRDLEALTGAGRAALDVGDASAALSFFARAEEVAPRDGRVKAGIGAALVQMEKPREALRLFAQAIDLGMPAASLAADRGLAYDLRGDNRRAQADYALALRTRPDDETVRRLALSQAMSGDRAAALATLDPLLRRQDRAAWRASTFVLAMTGDAKDATERLGQLVTPPQAAAMAPFLGRLATLKPADQAEAVHFGHLPADGRATGGALAAAAPAPGADRAPVPAGAPLGASSRTIDAVAATDPSSGATRRRPGHDPAAAETLVTPPPPVRLATAEPPPLMVAAPAPAAASLVAAPTSPPGASVASPPLAAPVAAPRETVASAPGTSLARGVSGPIDPRFPSPAPERPPQVDTRAAPTTTAPSVGVPVEPPAPAPIRLAQADTTPPPVTPVPRAVAKAEDSKRAPEREADAATAKRGVDAETSEADARAAGTERPEAGKRDAKARTKDGRGADAKSDKDTRTAKGKRDADAKTAKETRAADAAKAAKDKKAAEAAKDKADKAKLAAAAKKAPQRYWVQVATGAYKADLPKSWANVKAKYPQLMAGKSPWTTPLRFTNRLLVGPFKSSEEAQGFVNTAGKAGFGTSPFTSPAGQAVERLAGK